jgi:hypothetical protein
MDFTLKFILDIDPICAYIAVMENAGHFSPFVRQRINRHRQESVMRLNAALFLDHEKNHFHL